MFTWTVQDGFDDDDGVLIAPGWFRNTSGVTDQSGNAINSRLPKYYGKDPGHRVGDLGAPVITDAAIIATPANGVAYRTGETIGFALTVSEPVTVPAGEEPKLIVKLGNNYPSSKYDHDKSQKAGNNRMMFNLPVMDGHLDDDGILLTLNSLGNANGVSDPSGNILDAHLRRYHGFPQQPVDAGAKPSRPYNLKATPGNGQITLSWWNPGNRYITHYRHRQSTDGGSTWENLGQNAAGWFNIPGSGADTTSYTVPDLESGVEYTFQIVAINARNGGGSSEPSRSVRATPN